MALTFQLAAHGVPGPDPGQVFLLEALSGKVNLQRLQEVAAAELQQTPIPSAFVWDDLVYERGRRGAVQPYRLCWPQPDSWLTPQVSHRGRCAIRGDILHRLYHSGKLTYVGDTSQALTELVQMGERVHPLAGIVRFVGWSQHPLYAPLTQPRPDRVAQSISIIINYRDRPDLMAPCLESIAQQQVTARREVILVDNQSHPHHRREIERQASSLLPSDIEVTHLTYDAPFSHSAQTNLGVSRATGEVLFMLNNDARLIQSDTLQTLANWALMPAVATVGPRVMGQRQRLVSSGIQVYRGTAKQPAGMRESTVVPLSQTIHSVAGNSFACAAIPRTTWETLGGLDHDRFPTQYNDADYCLRALEAGLQHIYIGTQAIYHEPGQSEHRTRDSTARLHQHLRDYHPELEHFAPVAPGMVSLKGASPLDLALNRPPLLLALEAYRQGRKTGMLTLAKCRKLIFS
jgi:GT2 family glycosyltransferase